MIVLIFLYFVVAVFYEVYAVKKYCISPSIIFIAMQMLMFFGVLSFADLNNSSDCKLIIIYFVALLSFILGVEISNIFKPASIKRVQISEEEIESKDDMTDYQKFIITVLIIVSVILCLYLFVKSGYNVFLLVLKSIRSGEVNNYTEGRLQIYNIQGIGYIYQFRVIILPILCAIVVSLNKNEFLHKFGICVVPFMIVFILGTGQRGGFVMFILMVVVALILLFIVYKDSTTKRYIVLISMFGFAIFSLMTIFNGRVKTGENVISAVLQRVFDDNQKSAVIGFRYIDSQEIQWGKDWLYSFFDLLPGKNEYTQLSYKIFKIMYGSTRGTAPVCIWGSTYYNWGETGIIIFPFVLGACYHRVYYNFCKQEKNKLNIFIYAAKFVVLGNWIADTPLVLFNQGFITLCILSLILNLKKKVFTYSESSVQLLGHKGCGK